MLSEAIGARQSSWLASVSHLACWTVIEPQKEMLLGSGAFGTDHHTEPGADRQSALLELLGRTP